MSDIASNPRLLELIELANNANRLHRQLTARKEDASEVDAARKAIFGDIGTLVHRLMTETGPEPAKQPSEPALPRAPAPVDPADQTFLPDSDNGLPDAIIGNDDERDGGWYTEDVEFDTSQPLFSDEDNLEEFTDVPESDPVSDEVEMGDMDTLDDEVYDHSSLAQLAAHRIERGHALYELANPETDPTWSHKLTQLLGLLNLPDDFGGNDEMAVEASRVQWAAGELGRRLDGFPASVQVCIVGLLAARAQHLRTQLTVDVGPRLALDRLRCYRIDAELPTVAGLVAEPAPESGSWVSDIHEWWALLQPDESVD
jgi:hypothetical protein